MKKIIISVILALTASAAFAQDEITTVLPTNVFINSVSVSSSSLKAVRVGINSDKPTVAFNVGGNVAPMYLMATTSGLLGNNMTINLTSNTLADLLVMTPTVVGQIRFCSTCVPPKIVVSTGTSGWGQWADAVGAVFK
jgi:hypothetical protein